ncbi:MAG: exosome complex exonuclease Rrp41 [Candidatus Nanoarchaeia archaeon]|nr:exosome complex exonuclease Rrp41 [Candidatus Nanoarchaeia archaeon]
MALAKRIDGRKFDELRPMEAKVGVVKRANGSAMFKIGNTQAIAAVYGPKQLYPGHLQNPETGLLRCNYNMIAFSGSGNRVRPGPNRRSKEISMVTESALNSVIDLSQYPNAVVDIFIELVNTDAGTRCAGICAAAMALADAGIPMKELVAAVSVGKMKDSIIVDLNYEEDSAEEGVDFPVAVTSRTGKISLLQMDGILKKDDIKEMLRAAKKASEQVHKLQVKALKEKYEK